MAWYEQGKVMVFLCRTCGRTYEYSEWIRDACCVADYHAQRAEKATLPWLQRVKQWWHGWALQLTAWVVGAARYFPWFW